MIFRRRRAILLGSLGLVLAAALFALPVFGELGNESDFDDPSAEAVAARNAIVETTGAFAAPQLVVLVRLGAPVESAQARERIRLVASALRYRGVARVISFASGADRRLVSRDGRSTYLLATFKRDPAGARPIIEQRLAGYPWVVLGGGAVAGPQVGDQVSADIARAELIAFPILFLLSLIVFRSAVSALLPLAVGAATILLSFLAIRVIHNSINPMSIYALNLINGLGLGLAIDYSLFMVSRFREELAAGRSSEEALAVTLRTAGRVVAFSAVTVAAALAALIVFRQRFLYSMGVGGALCALIAAGVSLTLLPALLGTLGERVNAGGPRRWKEAIAREAAGERSGFWYRHSRWVMRRPVPVATGAAVLLIALGLPFLRIEFTGVDPSVLPRDQTARIVDDAIQEEFPPSETSPVYIAVDPRAPDASVRAFAARLPAPVGPPRVSDGRIDLIAPGPPLGARAKELVSAVRATPAPFEFRVGGQTALFVDQQNSLGDHLPLAFAFLCATTLIILFFMTRSVVLPLKALIMNLLSLSAAFGLLVLVFQDGHLEGLLAFDSQGAIESSQPVLLFAVAFGLSTDYGVFLLGRIKELHDGGASNEEAVSLGLQRTGRIITFAALLMVIAIGSFVTAEIIFVKQLGFGVAMAVLIDATIVRALLVPALMRLLGNWNWWVPRPLAKLLPSIVNEIGYLGLGSNVGDRRVNLQASVEMLWAHDVVVLGSSSVYETEPVGEVLDQRPFYNAVVRVETGLAPLALLDACKAVERAFGRVQMGEDGYVKDGPRPIDVDVLLLGFEPFASARLTLPHREVLTRRFVMVPLLELDPVLELPGRGLVSDHLERLDGQDVRRAGPPLDVGP